MVIHHLLHLKNEPCFGASSALLSRMDQDEEGKRSGMSHSFILLPCMPPPNISESECNTQQLALMGGPLHTQTLQCCWLWLTNWKISGQYHPSPRLVTQSPQEGHGTKDQTPKKVKLVDTGRHSKEASQVP